MLRRTKKNAVKATDDGAAIAQLLGWVGVFGGIVAWVAAIVWLYNNHEETAPKSRDELRKIISETAERHGFSVDKFGDRLIDTAYTAIQNMGKDYPFKLDDLQQAVKVILANNRSISNNYDTYATLTLSLFFISIPAFMGMGGLAALAVGFGGGFGLSFSIRNTSAIIHTITQEIVNHYATGTDLDGKPPVRQNTTCGDQRVPDANISQFANSVKDDVVAGTTQIKTTVVSSAKYLLSGIISPVRTVANAVVAHYTTGNGVDEQPSQPTPSKKTN